MLTCMALLLSTLQIFVVKCDFKFVDPGLRRNILRAGESNIINMLGTMTPYPVPNKEETTSDNVPAKSCMPNVLCPKGNCNTKCVYPAENDSCNEVKALLITRHGEKYPKEPFRIQIKKLEGLRNHFQNLYFNKRYALIKLPPESQNAINDIMKWKNKMTGEKETLNDRGKSTMSNLGARWNSKLINIVNNIKKQNIMFISAIESRCIDSGIEFFKGFLKITENEIEKIPRPKLAMKHDTRINVEKPASEDIMISDPLDDKQKYVEDHYYKKICSDKNNDLIKNIQQLLFPDNSIDFKESRKKITCDIVKIMYSECAQSFSYDYEKGVNGQTWCIMFKERYLKMFERMHDLQYYYKNGYFTSIGTKAGHPMINDILNFLDDTGIIKFKLFSGHGTNCMSMVTGFRLFRDTKRLTIRNMDKMGNRKWRSSSLFHYACHVMVVVYDCGTSKPTQVSIYFNEIPLEMILDKQGRCTQCPITGVKTLFKKLLD